jgi:hypothetical protein
VLGEAQKPLRRKELSLKKTLATSLVVWVVLLMIAPLAAPAVLADEAGSGDKKMPGWPLRWKATSPAIHEGDRYTLLMRNNTKEDQEAQVRTVIMDHSNHTNTNVIDEQLELAPGEERKFTAINDYGTANHFNTIIGSETEDLDLAVSVADSEGTETARFNDKAFLMQEGKGANGNGAKAKAEAEGHAHGEGFATSLPTALWDIARLSPLSLGVFAVAGFGLYAARRRWALGTTGRLTGPFVLPPVWKAAAVGGLALSAALHIGLAPAHFEEAFVQGAFFCAAGVIAAIVAAGILTWPSRLVYLAGVGISLALVVLWAVFQLVPPPGSETAEAIDLVGLFTKVTELVAAIGCTVLWFRSRRTHHPRTTNP